MANLKNKILCALKNVKQLGVILDELSQSQENLLKNHSNPVFSQKDKNKILKKYMDLQNLSKSLNRYGVLKENNYLADAQNEKNNIKNMVLKDEDSKYIWCSENSEKTCDKCKELDGQIYEIYDEVPERPHPNCKCKLKVIEDVEMVTPDEVIYEEATPEVLSSDSEKPSSEDSSPQKWIMPCKGPITSGYGPRVAPVPGASEYHKGWDIGVQIGTPVKTIADGKVIAVGPAGGYGYWVAIDHGIINGTKVTSEYGHISSWNVRLGQLVKQGQVIAKSGNAGYSSKPHLHITIREGNFQGTAVNPSKYIDF